MICHNLRDSLKKVENFSENPNQILIFAVSVSFNEKITSLHMSIVFWQGLRQHN